MSLGCFIESFQKKKKDRNEVLVYFLGIIILGMIVAGRKKNLFREEME